MTEKNDKVTYEMSGPPPEHLWRYKADFENDMLKWGYQHTTLTKKTDMLIVTKENLNTTKCKKAEKYGTQVYTYEEAFNRKENLYVRIIRKKKFANIAKNITD